MSTYLQPRVCAPVAEFTFSNGAALQGRFLETKATVGGGGNGGTAGSDVNVRIGVFDNGQLPPGTPFFPIFGVGPIQGEATQPNNQYPNLPQRMKEEGLIKSNAFGVYTNDFRAGKGSVVFGGVDTAKFDGKLAQAPLLKTPQGDLYAFVVQLSSIRMTQGGGRGGGGNNGGASGDGDNMVPSGDGDNMVPSGDGDNMVPSGGGGNMVPPAGGPILFDTGNSDINLPPPILQKMAQALGTSVAQDGNLGPIDCNMVNSQNVLQFGFNEDAAKIDVPLDTIVVPQQFAQQGQQGCQLPIGDSDDLPSLGAPFLQNAYVVFDMDQKSLHMAQAKLNVTESNIQEFP